MNYFFYPFSHSNFHCNCCDSFHSLICHSFLCLDNFGNKRLDIAGPLMGNLFRILLHRQVKQAERKVRRWVMKSSADNIQREHDLKSLLDEGEVISKGLKYSLATGNWGPSDNIKKTGVSQILQRLTFASTLSHLRRLNTPLGRDGKLAKPRMLHNTHWGMCCPAETPEVETDTI